MFKRSTKLIDKVIDEAFWEGFQDGLGGGSAACLEYGSGSGRYHLNGVRRIAVQAGWEEAQRLVDEALTRRSSKKFTLRSWRYEIPASVVAECYAAVREQSEPKAR